MKDIKILRAEAAAKKAAFEAKEAEAKAKRIEAAEIAVMEAIVASDGDVSKVIVHRLDPSHGGAAIYKLPTEEYWDRFSRRYENAYLRKTGPSATTVVGELVENPDLLIHPPLSELQAWKDRFPGLYDSIHSTISERCAGIDPGKG